MSNRPKVVPSRRAFLKSAAVGACVASLPRGVHAAGSDAIKIGLIGCGGRGSGAAVNAMNAGKDVKLVAMGDVFPEYCRGARDRLAKLLPEQVDVPDDRCFTGFDAYQQVIGAGVDVVLIAAASHFHPQHLEAAVAAGKHVFCEKPHGVDVPGLRRAIAAGQKAKEKGLALVSGLCWRYDSGVREAMRRVGDGAIGDIVAIQETYITSPYGLRERRPEWNEMQYQLQNWYHFNWLSGDQTGQQLIHSIDKASWALGDRPPLSAWGLGGRQVHVEPKYGDQFDHHAVVYEYEGGVRVFGFCRDQVNCYSETSDVIVGTKGKALLPSRPRIEGEKPWRYEPAKNAPAPSMYDVEHQELFASIREGKPINNSGYMFTSTMLGILAQMVCYTGQRVSWDEAMKSELRLAPSRYAWDAEPPVKPLANGQYPTAMPGVTKFA